MQTVAGSFQRRGKYINSGNVAHAVRDTVQGLCHQYGMGRLQVIDHECNMFERRFSADWLCKPGF